MTEWPMRPQRLALAFLAAAFFGAACFFAPAEAVTRPVDAVAAACFDAAFFTAGFFTTRPDGFPAGFFATAFLAANLPVAAVFAEAFAARCRVAPPAERVLVAPPARGRPGGAVAR